MSRLGEERDRVGEVPANRLDHREASENQKRNDEPALASAVPRVVRALSVPMPVLMSMGMTTTALTLMPMPMPMPVFVLVPVLMVRVCAVAGVMITVVLVRMRHGFGSPVSGCILKTL